MSYERMEKRAAGALSAAEAADAEEDKLYGVCTVHNLLKLAAAKLVPRWSLSAALPPALAAR
jgi:hypothetical protein